MESVEFSNPDLVWVGKAESDTVVRELKEASELEVKYSEDLTVKDIARINAQTVKAGDWALISLLPIETDETLTVTMKSGEVFTIQVASQAFSGVLSVQYASADGSMVVTACAPEGVLPEGTKIVVREIDPFTEAEDPDEESRLYAEARAAVANMLWKDGKVLADAKVVDISFVDLDGKEVEPKEKVDVSIKFAEALDAEKYNRGEEEESGDGEDEVGDETKAEVRSVTIETALAHITEEGEAEPLKAEIEETETVFSSDAF